MHTVLSIRADGQPGRCYVLRPGQVFVLGRSEGIHLKDGRISRKHASIELRSEELFVTDHKSRNGTYVDGRRLPPDTATQVFSGSVLRLGRHEVTFEVVGLNDETSAITKAQRTVDGPALPEEFELREKLGEGAVGRVWTAYWKPRKKIVAIKLLRPKLRVDGEELERFLREGRLYAQVKSPHVVEVYDVRVAKGRPFIVMELVQGSTALDRLEQHGALPLPDALRIGEEIAKALVATAAAGVVHRDVKPGNILLAPGGAKLSDFGIGKELDRSSLTEAGLGLGSLPYAPPEQVRSASDVDLSADIYGLGAALYHLIAGYPPFPVHVRFAELLRKILNEAPTPLDKVRMNCPREIAAMIQSMLAKDRTKRPTPQNTLLQLTKLRQRHCPTRPMSFDETEDGDL